MSMGPIRIGNAPVSYGVFGDQAGGEGASPEELLETIAAAGYEGSELGPPGFFGTPEQLAASFARVGLRAIGAYVPLHLGVPERTRFAADLASMRRTCEELVACGGDGLLVCADEGSDLLRRHAARTRGSVDLGLDDAGWSLLAERLEEALGIAGEFGLTAVFHPHLTTFVESPEEIARLLETAPVTLAFDTGHIALGGGDICALARRWAGRIGHVHVKDVDSARFATARQKNEGAADFDDWWGNISVPLGAGDLALEGFLAALAEASYSGWLVVEQDRDAARQGQYGQIAAEQKANRDWLVTKLNAL